MRERILGLLLVAAGGLVAAGVAMFSERLGVIVTGVLVAALAWLFLGEVDG